jgi:hypothetical protein
MGFLKTTKDIVHIRGANIQLFDCAPLVRDGGCAPFCPDGGCAPFCPDGGCAPLRPDGGCAPFRPDGGCASFCRGGTDVFGFRGVEDAPNCCVD